jgi:hypothetical protein
LIAVLLPLPANRRLGRAVVSAASATASSSAPAARALSSLPALCAWPAIVLFESLRAVAHRFVIVVQFDDGTFGLICVYVCLDIRFFIIATGLAARRDRTCPTGARCGEPRRI